MVTSIVEKVNVGQSLNLAAEIGAMSTMTLHVEIFSQVFMELHLTGLVILALMVS